MPRLPHSGTRAGVVARRPSCWLRPPNRCHRAREDQQVEKDSCNLEIYIPPINMNVLVRQLYAAHLYFFWTIVLQSRACSGLHIERDMLRRFSYWSLCSHSLSLPPSQLPRESRNCTRPPPPPRSPSVQLSPPRSRTAPLGRWFTDGHAHQRARFQCFPKSIALQC